MASALSPKGTYKFPGIIHTGKPHLFQSQVQRYNQQRLLSAPLFFIAKTKNTSFHVFHDLGLNVRFVLKTNQLTS
jgi:hypothetical protein